MKLTIINISKTYPTGVQAPKNGSLAIPNGMYDLLRFNGAGKSKLIHFFLLTLPLLIALLVGTTAYAQVKTSEIDKIFSWATPATPGCAMAVSHDGKVIVNRAYGMANLEREVPITPATKFDVGSLQKQFIAAAVLLLVEDGRISLTDDIRRYIPELPEYDHTIRVDHLLTHTSGIRDWTALLNLSGQSEDALTLILRQRGLNIVPGEERAYSNSNYVLAKEIVARVAGMPFSEFAHERLLEPLGMEMTTYADDVRDVEDRALAYDKVGDDWRLNILVGNERGDGGALLSTASDLLIWNEALTNTRLGEFVTMKLQEPTRLNNGRKLRQARGLFIDEDPASKIVWYTGSAAGYKSFLARILEERLSLAVLCNAGESSSRSRSIFANYITDLFLPDTREADTEAEEPIANTDSINVNSKAGLYFSERSGEPLRLVVRDGRLSIPDGSAFVAVTALTKDRFRIPGGDLSFMSGGEFEVHFPSPDEFVLTSLEGETIRYRRARPYMPTAAELQDFTGRYESNELRALFEIFPGKEGVMIRLNDNDSQTIEFLPVDPDTFMRGRMMVRFHRDEDENVVSLSYSNPAIRNAHFPRLSDDTP